MRKTTLTMSALALGLSPALSPPSAITAGALSPTMTAQQMPGLALMLERVIPSVVSINVEGNTTVNTSYIPRNLQQLLGDDSPFCQDGSLFQSLPFRQGGAPGTDDNGGRQRKFMIFDSGVVIDAAKGYVMTDNHMVDNATVIKVQLSNGRKLNAKTVDKDSRSDIALTQIRDPKSLTAVKLADPDALRVGDYTMAIGNPFGLGKAVTPSIVFVLRRSGFNIENYENSIQADAAINRGSPGGTLVNLNGGLTDINTAILAPGSGSISTDFTVPGNMVESLTPRVVEFSQVKRDELGIMGTELSSELTKAMKIDAQCDAFVSQVTPNSSVAKAGIKVGSVVIFLSGRPINSFAALYAQTGTIPIGDKIALGLLRDGKPVTVNLELQQGSQIRVDSSSVSKGIGSADMSNGGQDKSVVVNDAKPDSPTTQIDLERGDVIIGANQQSVKSIAGPCRILGSELAVLILNIRCGNSSIYLLAQ